MPLNDKDLNDALLDAHARCDGAALITLYTDAAQAALVQGQDVAADFYLTHAYVFALERGDDRAAHLHSRLKERGREE